MRQMNMDSRIIIFHKHPVSAKVRFLKHAYGGICGFDTLPQLATFIDSGLSGIQVKSRIRIKYVRMRCKNFSFKKVYWRSKKTLKKV